MGVESSKKQYFKSNKVEHSNEKIYIDAIEKAVEEKCSMIGIIGDYGSGKSTVVQAYEAQHKKDVLKISIPSYLEEKTGDKNETECISRDIPKEVRKYLTMDIIAQMEEEFKDNKKFKGIRERLNYYDPSEWNKEDVKLLGFFTFVVLVKVLQIDIVVPYQWLANIINTIYVLLSVVIVVKMLKVLRGKMHFGKIKSFSIFKLGVTDGTDKSYLDYNLNTIIQLIQIFGKAKSNPVIIIEDLDRYENVELLHEIHQLSRLIKNVSFMLPLGSQLMEPDKISKYFDFQITIHPVNETTSMCEHIESELRNYRKQLLSTAQETVVGPEINIKLIDKIADDIPDIRVFNSVFNYYLVLKEKYSKVYPNLDQNSNEAQSLRTEMMTIAYLKIYYPKQFNTEKFYELIYLYKNLVNNTFRDKFIEENEDLTFEFEEDKYEKSKISDSLDFWIYKDYFKDYVFEQVRAAYFTEETEKDTKAIKDFYMHFLSLINVKLISYKWMIFISNTGSSTSEEEALIQIDTRRFKTEVKVYKSNKTDILFNNYNLSPTLIEYYDVQEVNNPNFIRYDYIKLLIEHYNQGGEKLLNKVILLIREAIFSLEYMTHESFMKYQYNYIPSIEFQLKINEMFKLLMDILEIMMNGRINEAKMSSFELHPLLLIASVNDTNNIEKAFKVIGTSVHVNQEVLEVAEFVVEKTYNSKVEKTVADMYLRFLKQETDTYYLFKRYKISDVSRLIEFFTRNHLSSIEQYEMIEKLKFEEDSSNIMTLIKKYGNDSEVKLENNNQIWEYIVDENASDEILSETKFINKVLNVHLSELTPELLGVFNIKIAGRIEIKNIPTDEELTASIVRNSMFEPNEYYLKYLLDNKLYENIIVNYSFEEKCITKEVETELYENYDNVTSKKMLIKKINNPISELPVAPFKQPLTNRDIHKIKMLAENKKLYSSFEIYRTLANHPELKQYVTKEFLNKIDVSTIVNSEKKDKVQRFIDLQFTNVNLTDEAKIILSNELTFDIYIKESDQNSSKVNDAVKMRYQKIECIREKE